MNEKEIQKVNEWFDNNSEYYGTDRADNEYTLNVYDMDSFTDFLDEEFPDLVYINCRIGSNDSRVWFYREDLENAVFM